jgi:hypothetical protein
LGGLRKIKREKTNTRKMTSTIHVIIVVLFLSACGTPTPTSEPTSTPDMTTIPVVMSDCFISFRIAAWQDLNGDGLWDISEPPLEGVKFQLQGIFAEKWGPNPDSSKGDGWFSILIWSPGDCIEQEYTITAVPPESYDATTPTVVIFSNSLPFEVQFGFRAVSK